MPFTKGVKTGGRIAGTPNKTTGELREKINQFVSSTLDTVIQDFSTLTPESRIKYFIQILSFALPKLSEKDLDHTFRNVTKK